MFLTQMTLVTLLFREQVFNVCGYAQYKERPTDIGITLSRMLCGSVMHFYLQNELEQGLKMMKFSLNHQFKFSSWSWAYLIGLAQLLMVVAVEVVNVVILCTNQTVMDIVMNFLALVIISEFDNYFVETLKSDPVFQKLAKEDDKLTEALKILVTTSKAAAPKLTKNKIIKKEEEESQKKDEANTNSQVASGQSSPNSVQSQRMKHDSSSN